MANPLRGLDLEDHLADATARVDAEPVLREDGSGISLTAFRDLLGEFGHRSARGEWNADRAASDAWLAPRLHHALRLTRAQAADRGLWHWVAVRPGAGYVKWRWAGVSDGVNGVADERWWGAVNKQAFARLWWGAELFRDGADYEPVVRAFRRQDLINSYLHRPLVRCRSFALGIVDVLTDESGEALPSRTVNDLARVLNLCTAGRPPEIDTSFQTDDMEALRSWARYDPPIRIDWTWLPMGPTAEDTTHESKNGGRRLARHGLDLAGTRT